MQFNLSKSWIWRLWAGLGVVVVCLVLVWTQLPDKRMHVWFLNIGQGDSILIKTPENHQILIDGGPGNKVLEELTDVLPFFDNSIDFMVLTHPDADHLSGLVEVLKRYKVENVLLSGILDSGALYQEFLREINQQGIKTFVAEAAVDFEFGDVLMNVVYPLDSLEGKQVSDKNNSSVATKIVRGDLKILLTGDLELEAEKDLVISGQDLRADIFKAGHHGSRTSSSPELIKLVSPRTVVIQSGKGNSFGHPHPETLRNFHRIGVREIRRNDLEGRIEFVWD